MPPAREFTQREFAAEVPHSPRNTSKRFSECIEKRGGFFEGGVVEVVTVGLGRNIAMATECHTLTHTYEYLLTTTTYSSLHPVT